MIGLKFILRQNNDPKHTANVNKNYFHHKEEQEVLAVKVWPPQSLDLNIIESVWDYMDRFLHGQIRGSLHPQTICGWFSKVFGMTCQPSSFKRRTRLHCLK